MKERPSHQMHFCAMYTSYTLTPFWNQASISNGFRDIQVKRNGMVDVTLIRPLNKGQGHSFWYQSISHIPLPIGCQ